MLLNKAYLSLMPANLSGLQVIDSGSIVFSSHRSLSLSVRDLNINIAFDSDDTNEPSYKLQSESEDGKTAKLTLFNFRTGMASSLRESSIGTFDDVKLYFSCSVRTMGYKKGNAKNHTIEFWYTFSLEQSDVG